MDVIDILRKPNETKSTEKQIEIEKMRDALTCIACEIQRFQESAEQSDLSALTTTHSTEKDLTLAELLKCKSKIRSKRDRIQKLRKNLKTACFLTKTVVSAKENESGSLKKHLICAESECANLMEKQKNNDKIISSLTRENQILRNKFDNVVNFTHLGYKELQKMRHEPEEETSVLMQLRKLIVCCGEYYADYCNEHEKCMQLKHKSSFLKNKISILESNVEGLSERLMNLKYRYMRLQKENDLIKHRCTFSEVKTKTKVRESLSTGAANAITYRNRESGDSKHKLDSDHDFDLSSHLSIVKKLLSDQVALLKDLQSLSHEFSSV